MALNLRKKPLTKAERDWADQLLANWKTLNHGLGEVGLEKLRLLLIHELETKRRMPILERLVTRYSRLEAQANQDELARVWARGLED